MVRSSLNVASCSIYTRATSYDCHYTHLVISRRAIKIGPSNKDSMFFHKKTLKCCRWRLTVLLPRTSSYSARWICLLPKDLKPVARQACCRPVVRDKVCRHCRRSDGWFCTNKSPVPRNSALIIQRYTEFYSETELYYWTALEHYYFLNNMGHGAVFLWELSILYMFS